MCLTIRAIGTGIEVGSWRLKSGRVLMRLIEYYASCYVCCPVHIVFHWDLQARITADQDLEAELSFADG